MCCFLLLLIRLQICNINANFIPGDKAVENYLRNNIDFLKREYDLAIILISHDLEYVARYSDRVVLLNQTIVKEGTPKEVFHSEEFKETFGKVQYLEEHKK